MEKITAFINAFLNLLKGILKAVGSLGQEDEDMFDGITGAIKTFGEDVEEITEA